MLWCPHIPVAAPPVAHRPNVGQGLTQRTICSLCPHIQHSASPTHTHTHTHTHTYTHTHTQCMLPGYCFSPSRISSRLFEESCSSCSQHSFLISSNGTSFKEAQR